MSNELDLDSSNILNYFHTNLDNLSNIQEGYKIFINNENIIMIDEPCMFQGLYRYYNNSKRSDAVLIITKLFDNIERYFNSLYIKICMIKNHNNIMAIPESIINDFKLIIDKMKKSKESELFHYMESLDFKTDIVDNLNKSLENLYNYFKYSINIVSPCQQKSCKLDNSEEWVTINNRKKTKLVY